MSRHLKNRALCVQQEQDICTVTKAQAANRDEEQTHGWGPGIDGGLHSHDNTLYIRNFFARKFRTMEIKQANRLFTPAFICVRCCDTFIQHLLIGGCEVLCGNRGHSRWWNDGNRIHRRYAILYAHYFDHCCTVHTRFLLIRFTDSCLWVSVVCTRGVLWVVCVCVYIWVHTIKTTTMPVDYNNYDEYNLATKSLLASIGQAQLLHIATIVRAPPKAWRTERREKERLRDTKVRMERRAEST